MEDGSLPWTEYEDVQLYVNEFIHPASLNRGYRRLLENDRFIKDSITPKSSTGTFSVSADKKLEIVGSDGKTYYVQLLEKT